MWEVEATDEFAKWYSNLGEAEADAVDVAVEKLEETGPNLRRPFVDVIKQSELANLKELIPAGGGGLRVLFVFDPRRHAILLLGGDKTGDWNKWYDVMVPRAERLYETYLSELRKEKLIE